MLPSAAVENATPAHTFAVGQVIEFVSVGADDSHVTRGTYIVQRLLPSETRDMQYRVKHTGDGHERVLRESQLRADTIVSG